MIAYTPSTLSSLCACSLGSHNLSRQNNGLKQQSRLDHTTRKALYDAASHAAYPPVPLSCKTGTRTQALSLQPPLQPFSQKSRIPTVAKECQIGLYDPAEADLELFRNSWSAGFSGERLSWSYGPYRMHLDAPNDGAATCGETPDAPCAGAVPPAPV